MDVFYKKKSVITLLIMLWSATQLFATDYYSNGTGNFTNPNIWGVSADGTGANPSAIDFTSGTHNFIINAGHTIRLNDSVNCAAITINGILTFGNNAEARSLVTGNFAVQAGASVNVANFNAFHKLYVNGNFTNNGTVNLKNNSSQVVNVEFNGIFNLDGNNTPIFNSITFKTGTRTVSTALNIDGAVIIENGATFASQTNIIHTVAGNWIEKGSGQITNGNINFDGTLVQSVSAATFEKITFSKGGIVNFSGIINVNKHFEITENTNVKSSHHLYLKGDFTVATGSAFEASAGIVFFQGTEEQKITLSDACKFYYVYFQNGSSTAKKIINGDATFNYVQVQGANTVVESTGKISFANGFLMQGKWNFNGQTVYLKGGTFHNNIGDNSFSFETSEVVVEGPTNVYSNSTMKVNNNVSINSGYLVIRDNSFLVDNDGTPTNTLTLKDGASLYLRGANNFPNFKTYHFEKNSTVRYDGNINQNIRGGVTYGNLYLHHKTKTADGNLDIRYHLYLNRTTLDLSTFNHTLGFHLFSTDQTGAITSSGGKFTLNGDDVDQIIYKGAGYKFNDLELVNVNPTVLRTKYIQDNVTLTGSLLTDNSQGGESGIMQLQIYDHNILKEGTAESRFELAANVRLYVSGENSFNYIANNFTTKLDPNSIVRFARHNGVQKVPSLTYGTIELWGTGAKNVQGDLIVKKNVRALGYVPVLTDNGYNIAVGGNWNMGFSTTKMTGSTTFNGNEQYISSSNFGTLTFEGSGKKVIGALDVARDLVIGNGVIVDAADRNINLGGNWNNQGTGVFTQNYGRVTFDGINENQSITANATNNFGNIYIEKTGTNKKLIANTDIHVNRNFIFTTNKGDFDLNGKNIYIGGHWYIYEGCTFTHNQGKIIFNGSQQEQLIRNYTTNVEYYDIKLTGTSLKRFYQNNFDINGTVEIDGANVTSYHWTLNVAKNWINTGAFESAGRVIFDGADQSIGGSDFHDIEIAGTGTKTLAGNISCSGWLRIKEKAKLDVSANNYNITVEEHWYNKDGDNSGYFDCRRGTVNFIGGSSNIETGGIEVGKQFYNLNVTATSSYSRLFPIEDNPIKIRNNFVLNSESEQPFYVYSNDMYVGGSFINNGVYFNQNRSGVKRKLEFTGETGTFSIDFGVQNNLTNDIIISGGATYENQREFELKSNNDLTVSKGKLDLNSHSLEMQTGKITIEQAGEIEVDSAAVLRVNQGTSLINNGGKFTLVGTKGGPATLTARTGTFNYQQTGATAVIRAKYFVVSKTNTNGIDIQEGRIHPADNFSNGTFTDGIGNSYLKLTGINLGSSGTTAQNTIFNAGPTYNVERTSGTGAITFKDAEGMLAGEAHENDASTGDLIKWEYPDRITWDGGAGDGLWHSPTNWSNDQVPTANDEVYLDNTIVSTAYTITVAQNAVAKKINIVGTSGVNLTLNGGKMQVYGNLSVLGGNTITQLNTADTLKIKGNYSNIGRYVHNDVGVVKFNPEEGYHNISSNPEFNSLVIACDTLTTSMVLNTNITVKDIAMLNGTLSAADKTIDVLGNWEVNGGYFDCVTSTVRFKKNGNQTISGGIFYNLYATTAGTKNIVKNIEVKYIFDISGTTTVVDAHENFIYFSGYFRNRIGVDAFRQTGNGAAVFSSNCYIQNGVQTTPTRFNNLIFQAGGHKYIYTTIYVKNNFTVQTSCSILEGAKVIGEGTNNTFSMTSGAIYIRGENNFPEQFENINLDGGVVDYLRTGNQQIYPTDYHYLRLRSADVKTASTKTAIGNFSTRSSLQVYDSVTTLNMAGHTLTISGHLDFRYKNTPQVIWGETGKIVFNGAYQSIDPFTHQFNHIVKTGTNNLTLHDTITVSGDMLMDNNINLNMQTHKIICTGVGKTFTLKEGARIYSYVLQENGPGMPAGFAHYDLHKESRVYYEAEGKSTIYTNNGTINYGHLHIYTNVKDTLYLDGKLTVKSDFTMNYNNPVLVDNGYNMQLSGKNIDLRNYYPTNTITFDGEYQLIYNGKGNDTLKLNNVITAGARGQKRFYEPETVVKGNLTIGVNDTLRADYNLNFSGETLINNGYFELPRNTRKLTFDRVGNQTINPGERNAIRGVIFAKGGTKTFQNYGINVTYGEFMIEDATTVDLGALKHTIGSEKIEFQNFEVDILKAENATIDFNRNSTQYIPKLKVNAIEISQGGWANLTDTLWTGDLKIKEWAHFRVGETEDVIFPIFVSGNWENRGGFNSYKETVFFESKDNKEKTIESGGRQFYNVVFNKNHQQKRTYKLLDRAIFSQNLIIDKGATLSLNGQNLRLGNYDNDDIPEEHLIKDGGTLKVDHKSHLLIDCYDGNSKITVNSGGTFAVLGINGEMANVSRASNRNYYDIIIESGATLKAQYYNFKYLSNNGLQLKKGAIIDPTNNLSNGIFSYMYTGTNRGEHHYLNIDTDVSSIGDINNVIFNFEATPRVGIHFNVKRGANATGTIAFKGSITGVLGGEKYENEGSGNVISDGQPNNHITWPPTSALTWTGKVSTNWFDAKNWSPEELPTANKDAIIPIVTNNPFIDNSKIANCKTLNITTGIVSLGANANLVVAEDVIMGSGSIIAFEDRTATIELKRDWTAANSATMLSNGGKVKFTSTTGMANIAPGNLKFGDVEIDGTASFYLNHTRLDINGDFTLTKGTFYPNRDNYEISLAGNFLRTAGEFSSQSWGVVNFDGADQSITNGNFSRVKISGTGIKTTIGDFVLNYNNSNFNFLALDVLSTLTAGANSTITIKGNTHIKTGGTFNDGNQTHHFQGRIWSGEGAYQGNGTIIFDGVTQHIRKSTFNNLVLSDKEKTATVKYLNDNIQVNGDFTIKCHALYCRQNTITNDGTGTFSMPEVLPHLNRIFISGTDNYPKGFKRYIADKKSYQIYNGTSDQIIKGRSSGSDPIVQYGHLNIENKNTKTLGGDIDIQGRLHFGQNSTLDVSANNYKINLAGHWYNQHEGNFICRQGDVILDGSNEWPGINQFLYLGTTGKNDFYKLTINSTSDYTRVYNSNITVKNNLTVLDGNLYMYNDREVYIYGDLTASNNGKFYTSGNYILKKPAGTANIQLNGSKMRRVVIDAGEHTRYTLLDNFASIFFDVNAGIFDGNGKEVALGSWSNVFNISGTYIVGAGGKLKIQAISAFKIKNGGVFEIIGEQGNIASVTNITSRYNFSVEKGGTIKAEHYLFEYMNSGGIFLQKGSIIDDTHNFSNGTFANPQTGGTCLRIENEQSFKDANRIENVNFPINPGNGTYNVTKAASNIGKIEFFNSKGALSGEAYDNDQNDLIDWTGPVVLTWRGYFDDNWFDKRNWEPNIGPKKIPSLTDDVIIAQALNNPLIEKDSALAKSITINRNAFLTIKIKNQYNTSDTALIVKEDFINNGNFTMTNPEDTIVVQGNWLKSLTSVFTPGKGTVVMKVSSGTKQLMNGSSPFNNLVIDAAGKVDLKGHTYVDGNLKILNGTLSATANNYNLFLGGNFLNHANFDAHKGEIIFQSNQAETKKIAPGNSIYNRIKIQAHEKTIYQLQNDMKVLGNMNILSATLKLNGKKMYFGNKLYIGVITIKDKGILALDANAQLQMYNANKIKVDNGGILKLIGDNSEKMALLTHQNSGKYAVEINSGGAMWAQYYEISNINENGIWFKQGAKKGNDLNNYNLSDGVFSEGVTSGQYLWFDNNTINATDTIRKVTFNSGAGINAKRTTGTNPVVFKDAFGLRGSYFYESDEETTKAAETGLVRWYYTDDVLTWTGNDFANNVHWDNPNNWSPTRVPTATANVFIPNVGTNKSPIIAKLAGEAKAMNITIYEGGFLTIKNNKNLKVAKNLTGAGKISIENASNTTIEVGENWDNLGIFEHGGNSTVKFTKASGTIDINPGNNAFYNIEFNSSNSAVFRTLNKFDVDGDFTVQANTTFKITSATHTLNIGGNFTNNGTFDVGTTTVTFDGAGSQSITKATGTETFAKLVFAGTGGTKTLVSDIKVKQDIEIDYNNTVVLSGTKTITLQRNWINRGIFIPNNGTVKMLGNTTQTIEKQGVEKFYNLLVKNTSSGTAVKLESSVNILNNLNLTDGILETSHSSILNILNGTSVTNASQVSYVSGPMTRAGNTDFVFPIGKGSTYARLELSGLATQSTFQAEYLDVQPTNRTQVEEPLSEVSEVEHWTLVRKTGTATPKVKLYFSDSIRSKIEKMRDVVVAVYNKTTTPNMWKTVGKKPATRVGKGGWVQSEQGISDFGKISIGFEYPTAVWTGNINTDWHTAGNWDWGEGDTGVPNHKVNVEIPVATNQPIISANNTTSYNLKIKNGGVLTIQANRNLKMFGRGDILSGGSFSIEDGSNSEITVNKTFENAGTFTPGNASTVTYAREGKQAIKIATFNHLKIAGTDVKTIENNINLTGNLIINNGSILDGSTHKISIKGNWTNNGNFKRRSSIVEFVGTKKQTISKGGNGEEFYTMVVNNATTTAPQIVLGGKVTIAYRLNMLKGKIATSTSNILSISSGATTINSSTNSYVVGPMRKYGAQNFMFPIGKDSVFAKIALSNINTNGIFTAEYFIGSAGNLDKMDTDIKAVSAVEYWDIKRNTAMQKADVTLYYQDSARSKIANPDSLRVVHYNGTIWQDEGNKGNAGRHKAGWVKSGQFSSFSPITFGTINENDPLPIELTRFEANVVEKAVKLDWETATEKNNDYFTIERTTDGKNIAQIAKIKGAGNSFSPNYYSFVDKKPEQGISYYRLKQTDFDGKSETFNWLSVIYDVPIAYDDLFVELYPNPGKLAEMKVKIKTEQDKQVSVELTTMLGKRVLLHNLSINKGEEYILELSKLKLEQGIYLLNIVADKKQKQIKFVVE